MDQDKIDPLVSASLKHLIASPHEQEPPQQSQPERATRLPSYVSEPPSTLSALRMMAQEEESRQRQQQSTTPSPPTQSPFYASNGNQNQAWLHGEHHHDHHNNKNLQPSLAGDLMTTSHPEDVRHSPRPLHLKSTNSNPPLQPPIMTTAAMRNPLNRRSMGLVESRDSSDDEEEDRLRRKIPRKSPNKSARSPLKGDDQPSPDKKDGANRSPERVLKRNHGSFNDPVSGREVTIEEEYEDGDGGEDTPRPKFYHRWIFWSILVSVIIFVVFTTAGACMLAFKPDSDSSGFQSWRLCFFIAGLPVIWWIGDGVSRSIVWSVERSMFSVKNALYFAYAVRRPLRNVLRAALALGYWALIMTVNSGSQKSSVNTAYNIVLKLWACVTLFMTANLAKRLLAKIVALKFNQSSHLTKMYLALKHEEWLNKLLQPRQSYIGDGSFEDSDSTGKENGSLTASKSKRMARRIISSFRRSASTSVLPDAQMQRSSSSNLSDSLMFWRRTSEPMPAINEESSDIEMAGKSRNTHGNDTASPRSQAVKVDIDTYSIDDEEKEEEKKLTLLPPPPIRLVPENTKNATLNPVFDAETKKSPLRKRSDLDPDAKNRYEHASSPAGSNAGAASRQGRLQRQESSASGSAARARKDSLPSLLDGRPLPRDEVMTKLAKLERYIRKNALTVTFRDTLNKVEKSQVNNESEAQRVAYFLFWNVKSDFDKQYIDESDLEDIFASPQDVKGCFEMLDTNGNGCVTMEDCVATVNRIFLQRRNLAASLHDTRSITGVLETLIGVLLHVLFCFFYLLIFQVDIGQVWVSFSGVILAFSFMFGNSVRQTYENVVFLFAIHPYDIGDTLFIDSDFMAVDEITINFTCCLNSSNQKVWIPNQRLVSTTFINVTTSGDRSESMKVLVDFDTPPSVLDDLMAALETLREQHPTEFASFAVSLKEATVPMKLTINVNMTLSHPGTDLPRTAKSRTMMHICVARTLNDLGVTYTWPSTKDGFRNGAIGAAIDTMHPL